MFSDQQVYHVPDGHPSKLLWPKKENTTKNCFATAAPFKYKQKGATVGEAHKTLLRSMDGPVVVTMEDGEVYNLPIMGGSDRLSGMMSPSMEAFDLKRAFDFVLGHMIDHELTLLEEVKQRLENAMDQMDTKKVLTEGAVFYGLTERSSARPTSCVPPGLHNMKAYIPNMQDDLHFADLNWETIFEHLWPMELNFFSLTWSERQVVRSREHVSKRDDVLH
eukprot:5999140-Amphidinium_carterae.3